MKLNAILSALLFAAASSLSAGAYAATDAEKPAAAKVDKATAKKVKPHSHMEEKTGMPQQMPVASDGAAKTSAPGADKSKHSHPRDAK